MSMARLKRAAFAGASWIVLCPLFGYTLSFIADALAVGRFSDNSLSVSIRVASLAIGLLGALTHAGMLLSSRFTQLTPARQVVTLWLGISLLIALVVAVPMAIDGSRFASERVIGGLGFVAVFVVGPTLLAATICTWLVSRLSSERLAQAS